MESKARMSARMGMAVLAVALALALAPLASASRKSTAISHPDMSDIKMNVGESKEFQIALYNYGPDSVTIKMATENSEGESSENLDGVATFDREIVTLEPGTEDKPTIRKVTVTLAPTNEGIFVGNIVAYPVEPGTDIPMAGPMGCGVKITATKLAAGGGETGQMNANLLMIGVLGALSGVVLIIVVSRRGD